MDELHAYSERRVRAGIARPSRTAATRPRTSIEAVDGDLAIRVAVTVSGDEVEIDFTGTAPQYHGNLNCPLAVTRSACFFVVRAVTDPDVPASGGAFEPVTVSAPEGCLVNARPPAAVVAGNTETSSRITDVVLAAFGRAVDVAGDGPGNDEQHDARHRDVDVLRDDRRRTGRIARTPTGRRACMSRCRTRSTRPSRRSSSPTRCVSSATSCAAGRAAPGRIGEATEWSASFARSSRAVCLCSATGAVTRRAGARGGDSGARGRTLVNGEEIPGKDTRRLAAGDVVRTETPGGGGYGPPERSG